MLNPKPGFLASLMQMKSPRRRRERLAARLLLKELSEKNVDVQYLPSGAPYLPGRSEHVSFSHTTGYAAAIISDDSPVGIDIERISKRIINVRSHVFNEEEIAAIDTEHQIEHSLIYWCAKETVYKCMGQESVDFRQDIHILPFTYNDKEGSFEVRETRTDKGALYNLGYRIATDYVLTWIIPGLQPAVCSETEPHEIGNHVGRQRQ
jgi:phosphopantetheinyl transferase